MSEKFDELDSPNKQDYELCKDKTIEAYFKWFLIMSLFWRYQD